jgi:hypothetical protein
MSQPRQPELSIPSSHQVEEVDSKRWEVLKEQHMAGQIRMCLLEAPRHKDAWLWRVHYRVLK